MDIEPPPPVIELTDGVVMLRPLSPSDAEEHLAGDDEENVRWLSGAHSTTADVTAWIERNQACWQALGPTRNFGVWDQATKALAGNIEACFAYDQLTGIGPGEVNVAYSVFPQWRRKGYAVRAVNLLCTYLKELGLTTAVVRTHPENIVSIGVANRAGFAHIDRPDSELVRFERQLHPHESE